MPCCFPEHTILVDEEAAESSAGSSSATVSDELDKLASVASLHSVGTLIPSFSNPTTEAVYASYSFRNNVALHMYCMGGIVLLDVGILIFLIFSRDTATQNSGLWDVLSDVIEAPFVVALLCYRASVHMRTDRQQAQQEFSLVYTSILLFVLSAACAVFLVQVTQSSSQTLALNMSDYGTAAGVQLAAELMFVGFMSGTVGLRQPPKFRFCFAILAVMLLLSIAPFFVRFDAPSDASNCAALSYNMSMQAYAQMRLTMMGVACMLFFLLGFVFSHCIDCVWRERHGSHSARSFSLHPFLTKSISHYIHCTLLADGTALCVLYVSACCRREAFAKQATKRLTDRRLIESLDSERRALSLQRGADSRLNHMMKNKCGATAYDEEHSARLLHWIRALSSLWRVCTVCCRCGAAVQLLELMQHERTTGAYASARVEKQPRAGSSLAEEPVALEEAIVSLKQAIEWLHRRQVFIELESGSYHSRQTCCATAHTAPALSTASVHSSRCGACTVCGAGAVRCSSCCARC
jgi:hypothetical protein